MLLAPVKFNELLDKFFIDTRPPLPINFGTFGKSTSVGEYPPSLVVMLLVVFAMLLVLLLPMLILVVLIVILFVSLSLRVRFDESFVKFFSRAKPSLPPMWIDTWPWLKTTIDNGMNKDSTRSLMRFLSNSFSQSLKCPVLVCGSSMLDLKSSSIGIASAPLQKRRKVLARRFPETLKASFPKNRDNSTLNLELTSSKATSSTCQVSIPVFLKLVHGRLINAEVAVFTSRFNPCFVDLAIEDLKPISPLAVIAGYQMKGEITQVKRKEANETGAKSMMESLIATKGIFSRKYLLPEATFSTSWS